MKTVLVKLKGARIFRAGGMKGDRDVEKTVRSDTIYSAIVNKAFLLYDESTAISFADSLRVSSMIYEVDGNLYVFAPKYINPKPKDDSDIKNIKKRDFMPLLKLRDWFKEGIKDEEKRVKAFLRPRVSIDRVYSSTNLYFVNGLYFQGESCFIAQFDEAFESVFKASVRLLGDEGIGGDRTYGMGLFEPEFSEISLPNWLTFEDEADFWITLSLYRPTDDEIENVKPGISWYRIVQRSGWSEDNFRKPRVNYFEEGSVFRFKPVGRNERLEGYPLIIPGKPVSLGVRIDG